MAAETMPKIETPPPAESHEIPGVTEALAAGAPEVAFDPHSRRPLAEQIRADAESRGWEDLQGLYLELGNGQRVIVRDSSIQHEQIVETKKVGLPRFRGGLKSFGRPEIQTMYKDTGGPRLVKRGGVIGFERKKEEIGYTDEPYVTIESFDEYGNPVDVTSEHREHLYSTIREMGVKKAAWVSRREETDDKSHEGELPIGLGRDRSKYYDEITRQLEAKGITRWDGLTWTRTAPADHKPKSVKGRKQRTDASLKTLRGNDDKLGKLFRSDDHADVYDIAKETCAIVADTTLQEPDYNVRGKMWSRYFVIRISREYKDGQVVVEDKKLKDYALREWFQEPTDGLNVITDMHVPGADTRPKDPLARWYWDEERAWEGLMMPKDEHGMPAKDRRLSSFDPPRDMSREDYYKAYGEWRKHRSNFKALNDRLIDDRRTFRTPKETEDLSTPVERPDLKVALGILSMHGMQESRVRVTEGPDDATDKSFVMYDREEKATPNARELRAILAETGPYYFEAVVAQLYDESREGLAQIHGKLDALPDEPIEGADSWIVEGLLERTRARREAGDEHPLASVLAKPHIQRDLLDEHTGKLFTRASIKTETIKEEDGMGEDGRPKFKETTVPVFNEGLFRQVPIVDEYNDGQKWDWEKIKTWRDKTWLPIHDDTQELFGKLVTGRDIDYREFQALGRRLGEAIGE